MAEVNFEKQAELLRRIAARPKDWQMQKGDTARLNEIAARLDDMAVLRHKCLTLASSSEEVDVGEELSADLIKLLDLPTKQ